MRKFMVLWVWILSLALTALVVAQTVNGSIRGTVTDKTGSAIPGANVTVVEQGTNFTRTVQSGVDGHYTLLALPPGTYNVTIARTGFATQTEKNVVLRVNQDYIANATLQVGSTSQTVEVNGNPVQVQTTSTQNASTINSTEITTLPLNGRNWVQLQQTLPGVTTSSDRFGNFSTDGSRTQSNNYLINGTDWNDLPLNTPLASPSPDAIQEVQVITSTLLPEYGKNSGATLVADIKNGTNQWHGDAFDFLRDTSMNANSFFGNEAGLKRAPFHQNQFGGTIGGPIIHNKLFIFGSYQGTRNATGSTSTTSIFTPAQRSGDWGAQLLGAPATSSNVSPFPMFGDSASPCPVTGGTPCAAGTAYSSLFSTGAIPSQDFNPLAEKLLKTYVPNAPQGTTGDNYKYHFNTSNTNVTNQYLYRLDYNAGPNDRLYFYQFWQGETSSSTLPFIGGNLPGFGSDNFEHTQGYTADWTHNFTTNLLNDFKLAYSRFNFDAVEPQTPVLPSSFGFTGINPQNTKGAGIPYVGVSGFFHLGFSQDGPQPRVDDDGELIDHISWQKGNHTFMFGTDIRRAHVFNPFYFENNGYFSFAGQGNFSTGVPGADFLLGIPDFYEQASGGVINARDWMGYSFFQDQWQLSPKWNVVYGLGWEVDTPMTDTYNGGLAVNWFKPDVQSTVFPTAPAGLLFPGDQGTPASIYTTKWGHLAPRLGLIYHPTSRLSLHAGYGIYFDDSEEELTLQNLLAPPFSTISFGQFGTGATGTFADPYKNIQTGTSIANAFPFTPPTAGSKVDFSQFLPLQINAVDPNFTEQYVENLNAGVEYQMPWSTLFKVGYVGSFGHHLEGVQELNPLNPAACLAIAKCHASNEASFSTTGTTADPTVIESAGQIGTFENSNYHSLQISLNKPFSNGLQMEVAYTWAHALDEGSSYESGLVSPLGLQYNYGNSDFDIRNHLTMAWVYNLPKLTTAPWAVRQIVNGWQVSGIGTIESGLPFDMGLQIASSLTCDPNAAFFGCVERPDFVSPVRTYNNVRNSPNHQFFLTSSFAQPQLGTFGTAGRNIYHGPGMSDYDMAVVRYFPVTEGSQLEIRGEAFNIFNHVSFGEPNSTFGPSEPNFGQILGTQGNPRLVQLAAKFIF